MSPYMEHNLIPADKKNQDIPRGESYDYELIGVTVHTGTADGGHYYAFIKERTSDRVLKYFPSHLMTSLNNFTFSRISGIRLTMPK